jgi:hypothetical protein
MRWLARPLSRVVLTANDQYKRHMKKLTIRLPDELAAEIEAESLARNISRSKVVRDRLLRVPSRSRQAASPPSIGDLIGSVDGLPADLSMRKKEYLRSTGYGRERS